MSQDDISATITRIPLNQIIVLPGHNPRRTFRKSSFERLVDSIKEHGLIQAITVRPNPSGPGFALVTGERRFRACRQLGFDDLPCVVRDVDDQNARLLALLENLCRDELSVADEALSAQDIVDLYEGDHESAANALGWSLKKLRHRLRLLHCSDQVMDALGEERITLAHAELLATVPREMQDKALPRVLERNMAVDELREQVKGFSLPLSHATFDRSAAGCNTCPSNSSLQAELFETHVGDARCTNRACFAAHTNKALQLKVSSLREDYGIVALRTEKPPGRAIPLVVQGPNGVGPEQFGACRACKHRGAILDDLLGPTTGHVEAPLCFDSPCYAKKVAAYQGHLASIDQGVSEDESPAGDEQDSSDRANGAATVKRPTKAAAKKAVKAKKPQRPQIKASPAAVVDQHAATVRRVIAAQLASDPRRQLALAVYALARVVADETGRDGAEAVFKQLKLPGKPRTGSQGHSHLPAALAQMSQPDLEAALQRTAIALFDRKPSETGANRRLDRRAAAALLIDDSPSALSSHVLIDKAFLEAHTKAGLEDFLEQSKFADWMRGQEGGEKRYNAMLAGRKDDIVKAVLDAKYPGFDSFVPSSLTMQIANWRKQALR
ncbi:PRTRC system ParB family protein [Ahniella affigens]|uniref:PRTRC system ParB family protein n=1 Tax=Ahniella affigens TaxID=2021234 RepID=UPI0014756AAC|nr:PRTRC system ParB family protein [Ahniella affigens]